MRVAVVVQRYGPGEILGGAETHAALMAEILAREHEVEVLTTTAGDYHRWSEAYPPGTSVVGRHRVQRFAVERGRTVAFATLSRLLHDGLDARAFDRLSAGERAAFARRVRAWPEALQEAFIHAQGPIAPGLVAHLEAAAHDRVLFVTYLYPTTYDGLAVVAPERALVVPTLHDEPPAYLPAYGRRLARAQLLCSTDAEVALVGRLYPVHTPRARRIGYGLALPSGAAGAGCGVRASACPDGDFLLYAGRIDPHKGIHDLLAWYTDLRRIARQPPRLVLVGEGAMALPEIPGVEMRGIVGEDEKLALMRGALALVHPSPFESLGIVLLEAMACGTPVIVRAESEVMVEHCRRSGAGVWVRDGAELAAAVLRLAADRGLRDRLGEQGRLHVEREFGLEAYGERLLAALR